MEEAETKDQVEGICVRSETAEYEGLRKEDRIKGQREEGVSL